MLFGFHELLRDFRKRLGGAMALSKEATGHAGLGASWQGPQSDMKISSTCAGLGGA